MDFGRQLVDTLGRYFQSVKGYILKVKLTLHSIYVFIEHLLAETAFWLDCMQFLVTVFPCQQIFL